MQNRNIGAHVAGAYVGHVTATAAGAGDATEVDGAWVSRDGYSSAKLVVTYEAALADGETLSMAANMQDASDIAGTGAADYGAVFANAIVATGGSGGTTERGSVELDIDFLGGTKGAADGTPAGNFVRGQFTPDLSAGATDTVDIAAVIVFGGADLKPAVAPSSSA